MRVVSARLNRSRVYWFIAAAEVFLESQLISKLNSNLSGAEIKVISALTNKWIVSQMDHDWLILNTLHW